MALSITKHIARTNNTLIFGELNGNVTQGVPSLATAISGKSNWGAVIDAIFSEDGDQRLVVKSLDDVTNIFEPSYYFSVATENVEGATTMVVEHTLKYKKDALSVPLSRESLCFRILDADGRIALDNLVDDQRKSLRKASAHYVAAMTDRNPKRLREQENLRRNFISRLTEPVMTYLLLAESCRNYQKISKEDADIAATAGDTGQIIMILQPDFENFTLKTTPLKVKAKTAIKIEPEDEEELVKARAALQTDIKVGRRLVAGAVKGVLGAADPESLGADKQTLAKALIESGIADDVMLDHLSVEEAPEANANISRLRTKFLTQRSETLLLEAAQEAADPKAKKLAKGEGEKDEEGETEGADASTSENAAAAGRDVAASEAGTALVKVKELPNLPVKKGSAETLRKSMSLSSEELNDHIRNVESVALTYYDDEQQQKQLTAYLHTLTPAGKIENEIATLGKRRHGLKELRGEKGLELYLDLCLEEAAERSALVKHFRAALRDLLLKNVRQIEPSQEKDWQEFHDRLLKAARATFEDYMAKVAPLAANLLGIEEFLRTTKETKLAQPRVFITNTNLSDIFSDPDLLKNFESLLDALNSRNQEEFEKAISIAIVPRLPEYSKDDIFDLGYKHGFATFFSPDTPISFNTLNDPEELEELRRDWSSDRMESQSGLMCVPDHVILPADYKFLLGQFYKTGKKCHYELGQPVAVPACFTVAGMVARNDDPKYVKEKLKRKRIRIEDQWPCLGMRFDEKDHEELWESERLSEGVINEKRLEEALPMCVLEHAKDHKGKLKKQKLRYLNTLLSLQGKPVPLSEYRVAKYLARALRLNYPEGATSSALAFFADDLGGVSKENYSNSLLDKERYKVVYDEGSQYFGIRNKARDVQVTGFDFIRDEGDEA